MDSEFRPQLEAIKRVLPNDIAEVAANQGGEDFLLFEINAEWMFRFARNELTRVVLHKEIEFLTRFRKASPLRVPGYQYVGQDFGAYRKLLGEPITSELFQALPEAARNRIGRQLAAFLSAIHNFPVEQALEMGIAPGWNGLHEQAGRYFLEHVAGLLSPTACRYASECMEALLSEGFEGRVIHGDFYLPDHVFYDADRAELGVIDFADVTIYDPAHDFQCILEIGGESFFEDVLKHYRSQGDPRLLARSETRLAARPLFTAGRIFASGLEGQYAARLARIESSFA